jgi:hypothetical protein
MKDLSVLDLKWFWIDLHQLCFCDFQSALFCLSIDAIGQTVSVWTIYGILGDCFVKINLELIETNGLVCPWFEMILNQFTPSFDFDIQWTLSVGPLASE